MPTDAEILERLRPLLVEVLAVAPERIQPGSTLVGDLGAESIDLLDLSFRIEEAFGVTIEANELEREARRRAPGVEYESGGLLTDAALDQIRAAAPELDSNRLVKGLRRSDLPALLTVEFFVRLIARKLEAGPSVREGKGGGDA